MLWTAAKPPKLTDLGLSKLVDETVLKTICGTKIYMAPEILRKEVEVYSFKVDCWALVSHRGQHSRDQRFALRHGYWMDRLCTLYRKDLTYIVVSLWKSLTRAGLW